jgi:hypothetical protein
MREGGQMNKRNMLAVVCCCVLAFTAALPAGAQPALEQGLVLVGGGSDVNGWFDIATSSDTTDTSLSLYGWGGYTLAGGLNIGPYVSISWNSTENATDGTGSTSLNISPGVQLSYYASLGSILVFIRTIDRVSFWTGSTTVSGSTTDYDFQLSGFSTQLNAGVAFTLTEYLLLNAGPALYLYVNKDATYYHIEAGIDLGLVVLL